MDIHSELLCVIKSAIDKIFGTNEIDPLLHSPENLDHGDFYTNVAFVLAKELKESPVKIGEKICDAIRNNELIESVELAKNGFVNIHIRRDVWVQFLKDFFEKPYVHAKKNIKVNVEYVSSNPTGPLHAGHARGSVLGDTIANMFAAIGYDVTKEYVINDAGGQVATLSRTVKAWCSGIIAKTDPEIEPGMYPGEYVKDIAEAILDKHNGVVPNEDVIEQFAIDFMMDEIRRDLFDIGISHDIFFSEKTLYTDGRFDKMVETLDKKGLTYIGVLPPPKSIDTTDYVQEPMLLFKATEFGDDQDRPLKRPDGRATYFSGDAAYHFDKFNRGFKKIIDVFGADHDSHVTRIKAVTKALCGIDPDIIVCQMVSFFENGKPIVMSKRAGTFITLRDIIDGVGKDALRFFMLSKKANTHMDFDFEKVKEQTKDNPVFYIQYAHARCKSVLRAASASSANTMHLDLLEDEEIAILKTIADWQRQLHQAAESMEPHRLFNYMYKLASEFHSLWQQGKTNATLRFIQEDAPEKTSASLAVVKAIADILHTGISIFGVTPIEEMR